jgi:hypothetical protein
MSQLDFPWRGHEGLGIVLNEWGCHLDKPNPTPELRLLLWGVYPIGKMPLPFTVFARWIRVSVGKKLVSKVIDRGGVAVAAAAQTTAAREFSGVSRVVNFVACDRMNAS